MDEITKSELEKLSVMHEGDRKRNAADKIRGFLFQDYIAIKCLLQDQVEYVYLECLEDIDVFFANGIFEVIQVKYYPKTRPNMKEISTDLYYQYLRFQVLQSDLKVTPRLYIHRNSKIEKPTLEDMKTYIGLGDELLEPITYEEFEDPVNWLRTNIYSKNKKKEQKQTIFEALASEESLEKFVSVFDICPQSNINQYKEELGKLLMRTYPNPGQNGDEERWQLILLGLAVSYVQRRYILENPNVEQLQVNKNDFDRYMMESVKMKTDQTIASYLSGLVCEKYEEIISHNELSDLQISMLNLIYRKTSVWINDIGQNVDGQYRLLNTLSTCEVKAIANYRGQSIESRLQKITECHFAFLKFLGYLWKIILNICQEKVHDEIKLRDSEEIFDPNHYVDHSVSDYICLNFPEDHYVEHCVILPPASGEFKSVKRKIVERMVYISPKPEKWFFKNGDLMKGKNYYSYSTTNVNENPTVADLGEDSFYIECMDCIGIDEDEWSVQENCQECIFSEKCIEEEK